MCGIVAAVLGSLTYKIAAFAQVKASCKKIKHRGPDEMTVFISISGTTILGHVRLSINDVANGQQPLFSNNGKAALVANAEIYNFKDLQCELSVAHSTQSDCETILTAYLLLGVSSVLKLRGMFAFIIEDSGALIAARDPYGIKPMFYGKTADQNIFFASELKALSDLCQEVHSFPPGSYWHEGAFHKYYNVAWTSVPSGVGDVGVVKQQLVSAVQSHLLADSSIKFGVFLSGGIDSSVIAAILVNLGVHVHAFTIGMAGSKDASAAVTVANALRLKHTSSLITPEMALDVLSDVVQHLESFSPVLCMDAIPQYLLYGEAAKVGVRVIFTGEGADELFAGYSCFCAFQKAQEVHECCAYLLEELHASQLVRVDRCSMAHGVEARVPFLDTRFVEFAMQIDPKKKMSSSAADTKSILRKAFTGLLPEEILWRAKLPGHDGYGGNWKQRVVAHCSTHKLSVRDGIDNQMELFLCNVLETRGHISFECIQALSRTRLSDIDAKRFPHLADAWQSRQDNDGIVLSSEAEVNSSESGIGAISAILADCLHLESVDESVSLAELGADSLDVATIQRRLRQASLIADNTRILDSMTLRALSDMSRNISGSISNQTMSASAQEIRLIVREEMRALICPGLTNISEPDHYTPSRVALLFDGVGAPPELFFLEMLNRRDDFSRGTIATLTNALHAAYATHCVVAAELPVEPSSWDVHRPELQLTLCLIRHVLVLNDMFFIKPGVTEWTWFQKELVVTTGHSLGFLTAVIVASGFEDCVAFRTKADNAIHFMVRMGVAITNHIEPGVWNFLCRDASVDEVRHKCHEKLQVTVVNSPSICVVTGPPALISSFAVGFDGVLLPICWPVHCSMLEVVCTELESCRELQALCLAQDVRVPCVRPDCGRILTAITPRQLLDIINVAGIDWPSTLDRIELSDPLQIIHVGSAHVSSWRTLGAEQYSASVDQYGLVFSRLQCGKGVAANELLLRKGGSPLCEFDCSHIHEVLRIAKETAGVPCNANTRFREGLDSLSLTMFLAKLEQQFPQLPMTQLVRLNTLAEVAQLVTRSPGACSEDIFALGAVNGLRIILLVCIFFYHHVAGVSSNPIDLQLLRRGSYFVNPITHADGLFVNAFMLISGMMTFLGRAKLCSRVNTFILPLVPSWVLHVLITTVDGTWSRRTCALFMLNYVPPICTSTDDFIYVDWYIPSYVFCVVAFDMLDNVRLRCPDKLLMVPRYFALMSIPCIGRALINYSGMLTNFSAAMWGHWFPLSYAPVFFLGMALGDCSTSVQFSRTERKLLHVVANTGIFLLICAYSFVPTLIVVTYTVDMFLAFWIFSLIRTKSEFAWFATLFDYLTKYTLQIYLLQDPVFAFVLKRTPAGTPKWFTIYSAWSIILCTAIAFNHVQSCVTEALRTRIRQHVSVSAAML